MSNLKKVILILMGVLAVGAWIVFGGTSSSRPVPGSAVPRHHKVRELPKPERFGRVLQPGEPGPPPDYPVGVKNERASPTPRVTVSPASHDGGTAAPTPEELKELRRKGIVAY